MWATPVESGGGVRKVMAYQFSRSSLCRCRTCAPVALVHRLVGRDPDLRDRGDAGDAETVELVAGLAGGGRAGIGYRTWILLVIGSAGSLMVAGR